jgi:hypothetical protein
MKLYIFTNLNTSIFSLQFSEDGHDNGEDDDEELLRKALLFLYCLLVFFIDTCMSTSDNKQPI